MEESTPPTPTNQTASRTEPLVERPTKPPFEANEISLAPRDLIGLVIVTLSLTIFGIPLVLASKNVSTFDEALKLLTTVVATISGWVGAVIALYAPTGKGEG